MAPEFFLVKDLVYRYECDMWSLGIILYQMASNKYPFMANDIPALKRVLQAMRYTPLQD